MYHIKPLGMTKTQDFCHDFYGYMFLYPSRLSEHFTMAESLGAS